LSRNPVSVARNAILLKLQESGFENCLYLDDSLRLQGDKHCFSKTFGRKSWTKRNLELQVYEVRELVAGANNIMQTFRVRGQGRLVDDIEVNLLELRK